MKKRFGVLTQLLIVSILTFANCANAAESDVKSKIGIRINPLLVLIGGISAEVPIGINEHLAVAPTAAYLNIDLAGATSKTIGAGVRVDWHFRQVFQDGAYVSLVTSYSDSESSVTENKKVYSAAVKGTTLAAIVGYLWRWDNVTFNIGIGAGFSNAGKIEYKADDGEVYDQPNVKLPPIAGDLSLGWAF